MRIFIPFFFLLVVALSFGSLAQNKRGNIPIFGADKAALDFNFSPVVARLFESPMVQNYVRGIQFAIGKTRTFVPGGN
jgi:hypothetical protein